MRTTIAISLIGMLLWLNSFASCSLELPPLKERVKSADAVFIGVVLRDDSVDPSGDYDREAMVQVKKVFKGDVPDRAIIQYLLRKAGTCNDSDLGSLMDGMGEDKLFYVKRRNDRFFTSDQMGGDFIKLYHIRQDIAALPDVVKEASRPWWDLIGWTK